MNWGHSELEQFIRDDTASLRMADEGCPNGSTTASYMQNVPAANPSNNRDDLPKCCSAFNLQIEISALEAQNQWVASKTLVKTEDLRIVLTVLRRGAKMPEHHADARTSLQILSGAVLLEIEENMREMTTGLLISLDPSRAHAIEALEPSVLLMTMAWPTANTLRSIPHRGYS